VYKLRYTVPNPLATPTMFSIPMAQPSSKLWPVRNGTHLAVHPLHGLLCACSADKLHKRAILGRRPSAWDLAVNNWAISAEKPLQLLFCHAAAKRSDEQGGVAQILRLACTYRSSYLAPLGGTFSQNAAAYTMVPNFAALPFSGSAFFLFLRLSTDKLGGMNGGVPGVVGCGRSYVAGLLAVAMETRTGRPEMLWPCKPPYSTQQAMKGGGGCVLENTKRLAEVSSMPLRQHLHGLCCSRMQQCVKQVAGEALRPATPRWTCSSHPHPQIARSRTPWSGWSPCL